VFVVNSFSKYFGMTGWRLGWMVVPQAYVREIEKLAQHFFISPSTPAQHAALAAFSPAPWNPGSPPPRLRRPPQRAAAGAARDRFRFATEPQGRSICTPTSRISPTAAKPSHGA
jgi:aspartate/methionine/tyrosine aminotransferase